MRAQVLRHMSVKNDVEKNIFIGKFLPLMQTSFKIWVFASNIRKSHKTEDYVPNVKKH